MPAVITDSQQQKSGPSRKQMLIAFIAGVAITAAAAQAPSIAARLSSNPDSAPSPPVTPGIRQAIATGGELVQAKLLPFKPA